MNARTNTYFRALGSILLAHVNLKSNTEAFQALEVYRNARGSLSELKSHLLIAFDQGYMSKEELDLCINMIDEVGKMLNGLIRSTANFRDKLTSNT